MANQILFDANLFQFYNSNGVDKRYQLDDTKKLAYLTGSNIVEMKIAGPQGIEQRGHLRVRPSGYVYAHHSKPVIWTKFFLIGTILPCYSSVAKIGAFVKNIMGCQVPDRGAHDVGHCLDLSLLAWKAVVGFKGVSLDTRLETFALKELHYNGGDNELQQARSERFNKGAYAARCMQPLFHKEQLTEEFEKCDRYVRATIADQQPKMPWFRSDVEECTVCSFPCYRAERNCGCIYKIDCCAQRCYAIDLLCCFLCFWPEGECAGAAF